MTLTMFFVSAILISLSGVMAPGPITAATIAHGSKNPTAGIYIAIGHGIVEFPLMFIIFLGFGDIIKEPLIGMVIALAGGAFLLQMGWSMLRAFKHTHIKIKDPSRSPFMAGIILSIGNPYFLVWWATVGATLIISAIKFSLIILIAFAIVHWLTDLIWYCILSFTTYKAGNIWGDKFSQWVSLICGIVLLFFGGMFIYSAIQTLAIIS